MNNSSYVQTGDQSVWASFATGEVLVSFSPGFRLQRPMVRTMSALDSPMTIWEKHLSTAADQLFAAGPEGVYFAPGDGNLYHFDLLTGSVVQAVSIIGPVHSLCVDQDAVVAQVGGVDGSVLVFFEAADISRELMRVDILDGEHFRAGDSGIYGLDRSPSNADRGAVRVLHAETGNEWERKDSQIICDIGHHSSGVLVLTDSSVNGRIVSLLGSDGLSEVWSLPLGRQQEAPVSAATRTLGLLEDVCVVMSQDHQLVGVEVVTGEEAWRVDGSFTDDHALVQAGSSLWLIGASSARKVNAGQSLGPEIPLPNVVLPDALPARPVDEYNFFSGGAASAGSSGYLAVSLLNGIVFVATAGL